MRYAEHQNLKEYYFNSILSLFQILQCMSKSCILMSIKWHPYLRYLHLNLAVSKYKVFSHVHALMIFRCNIKFIRYNNCPCKCVKRKEQWNTVRHSVTAIKILKQDIYINNIDAYVVVVLFIIRFCFGFVLSWTTFHA